MALRARKLDHLVCGVHVKLFLVIASLTILSCSVDATNNKSESPSGQNSNDAKKDGSETTEASGDAEVTPSSTPNAVDSQQDSGSKDPTTIVPPSANKPMADDGLQLIWNEIGPMGDPAGRAHACTAWTGSALLVFGGMGKTVLPLRDGALYFPSTKSWKSISTDGAPSARYLYGCVWTGRLLFVWGGADSSKDKFFGDGALYDPSSDSWTPLPSEGAPTARAGLRAVLMDNERILVGRGIAKNQAGQFTTESTMAIYDVAKNSWEAPQGDTSNLFAYSDAALGDDMIWVDSVKKVLVDHGPLQKYTLWDPATGVISPRKTGGPGCLMYRATLSNGKIFAGCRSSYGFYDPVADSWSKAQTLPNGATCNNAGHVVSLGDRVWLWAEPGKNSSGDPDADSNPVFFTIDPFGIVSTKIARSSLAVREGASSAWTGSEIMVWGGSVPGSTKLFSTGLRFPWVVKASEGAPLAGSATGAFSGMVNGKTFSMKSGLAKTWSGGICFDLFASNLDDWADLGPSGLATFKHPQYEDQPDKRKIRLCVNGAPKFQTLSVQYDDENGLSVTPGFTVGQSGVNADVDVSTKRVKVTLHLKGPTTDIQGTVDLPKFAGEL